MKPWRDGLRRELHLLWQRPFDLAMLSWLPLLLGLMMIWSFAAGLPTRLPIGVLDGDHSGLSRQLQRMLDAAPGLRIAAQYGDEQALQRSLRAGEVYAALIIPPELARDIKHGQAGQLALLHNAQFATHSGLIQKEVRTVVGTLSAGIELTARNKRGQSPQAARQAFEPLRASLGALYNGALNYQQFLATALIPALLHLLAMVAGGWTVGRELRDATAPDWLAASQGQALPALLTKLLPAWVLLNAVNLVFWLIFARLGLLPEGGLAPLLALHGLMLALYLALGAAIALAGRSLRLALSAAGFITAPAFAFSGLAFPLMAMPEGARLWAQALPFTWVLQGQLGLLQMGQGLASLLPLLGGLLLATLGLLAAGWALAPGVALDPKSWGRR
ncbi:ABC-2 type transport system permease protein [Paucibacter oligotrophus]|uniref:ABC-2 type transport system permease protein n=1 Tax=Roseateles oligotrophus TaxID=1769250 RepID=A0A840L644_9BURK|nr:ABC-2 type transport system permease protein [Roseateles oligotrophus]